MKIIEAIAAKEYIESIIGIANHFEITDYWSGIAEGDERHSIRMLVAPNKRQQVLDALQEALNTCETARIMVIPVDVALPLPHAETEEESSETRKTATGVTREELYSSVEKGARLDGNYLILVFLSTIVAAIGLIENNVAVIIGAMVIAPLLGPNIAFALGSALGDSQLMLSALKSLLVGLGLSIVLAALISFLWPAQLISPELVLRTDVGLDGIALALASGAAAVLSLSSGLPSVLVGVMVAVALLPPAATLGLMLGSQHYALAGGATLLLAVNIVCVNLSAKLVLLLKGVKPRTWWEKKKARQSMTTYLLIWAISLAILLMIIYARAVISL